jgi:hypothetical protein
MATAMYFRLLAKDCLEKAEKAISADAALQFREDAAKYSQHAIVADAKDAIPGNNHRAYVRGKKRPQST